nr:hypothetical protein Iba_chr10eCG9260 [Ipomoea batatas]
MELSKLCWWKFPAIDLSAISDIDNSFTFARNSDAISTLGIIGFIFSAMVIFMSLALEKQQRKLLSFSSRKAGEEKWLPTAGVNPVV